MFWRLIKGAVFRQKRKMLLIALTVALGASLATAMLNVLLDVGDKVNHELKTYGANITVIPKEAALLGDLYGLPKEQATANKYLKENELGKIKTIFWAFNIVDFAPYLETGVEMNGSGHKTKLVGTWINRHLELPTGEALDTGMKRMKSWWDVSGNWLEDGDRGAAMVGAVLAQKSGLKVGDSFTVKGAGGEERLLVKGIFSAGSAEDEDIYVPLAVSQQLSQRPGLVSRVEVSALTTPDNELSRRAAQDPKSLSIKDWETWYCTAYVSAICYQIEEVVSDSVAKPIRQVAESEGAILQKTQLLMLLVTALSLLAAALGISNLVTASVIERSPEIGLLKAIGAGNAAVAILIIAETMLVSAIGGVAGYFAGLGFAQVIGYSVFGSAINIKPLVIPLVALLVFLVTIAGSIPAARLLLNLRPSEVLHGR